MNEAPKQSLAILRHIAEFLDALPADQLDDLAEGRARLTLIPWGSAQPLVPATKPTRRATRSAASMVDAEAVAAQLDAAESRDEAQATLSRLKVADLKAVAAALHIPSPAATKAALIKQIVDLTVGARLSGDALRAL